MIATFLIQHFSYAILFIWSILEGEIGLALGGFLSKSGDFVFSQVIGIAISGALIGDISIFLIGKYSDNKVRIWLSKYQSRLEIIKKWFKKNVILLILFERFIYGTHIPSLLFIGMSGYSFIKFLLLDIIGVTLWAFVFTSLGYYFGESVINIIMVLQRHLSLLFLILFVVVLLFIQNRRKS